MTARVGRWSSGHPRSLTLAFYRHGAILLVAAAVVVLLARGMAIEDQLVIWYVVAAALGVVTALVSGWLGLLFLVSGLATGVALDLAIRHSPTADAAAYLGDVGASYAGAALVAVTAFAIVLVGRRRLRRRG